MEDTEIEGIFYPHFTRRMENIPRSSRFGHYTSVESALKIISSSSLWLRKSSLMNDFSEIDFGLSLLRDAKYPLNKHYPVPGDIETPIDALVSAYNSFCKHSPVSSGSVYLSSFCEFDEHDLTFGRLSMWRAYASKNGCALIFNQDVFSEDERFPVISTPVEYTNSDIFFETFIVPICTGLQKNVESFSTMPAEHIFQITNRMLQLGCLSLKHPAFSEEKEWRIVNADTGIDGLLSRTQIKDQIEFIGGLPQQIKSLSLIARDGTNKLDQLETILIGPSEHPHVLKQALEMQIEQSKMTKKPDVRVTDIPIRLS